MISLLQLVAKLPIPTGTRLAWQRTLLEKVYSKEILLAQKSNNWEKVESLRQDQRLEMVLHEEEEDSYLTKKILYKARKLRVPVPHLYNDDTTESKHWYQGQYTGGWYLTVHGFCSLREEIRRELKAQHESWAQWTVWLSALTGVIGAITGLAALLLHK
ncbi:MAG: hypothetical protein V4525_10840 [Pseudomonadota bacterium]